MEIRDIQKILEPSFYDETNNTLQFEIEYAFTNMEVHLTEETLHNDVENGMLIMWLFDNLLIKKFNMQITISSNDGDAKFIIDYKWLPDTYLKRVISNNSLLICVLRIYEEEQISTLLG